MHTHTHTNTHTKGLTELLEEGAVQMLRDRGDDGNGTPILAAVGQLQFEVVEYRLRGMFLYRDQRMFLYRDQGIFFRF